MGVLRAGRGWRTSLGRIWMPEQGRYEHAEDEKHEADFRPNAPRCITCSRRLGRRVGVAELEMVNSGKLLLAGYYTDFRAKCHGAEEVLRINSLRWDRDAGTARAVEAIKALPFFAVGGPEVLQ